MKLKQAIDIVNYLSILRRIQEKTLKGVETFLRSCNFREKISVEHLALVSKHSVKWFASDKAEKFWILKGHSRFDSRRYF